MDVHNAVMTAAMSVLGARDFSPAISVVLILGRSFEEDSALIDVATSWVHSAECEGRSRRAHVSKAEAIFEFEHERDAAKFRLLFG